MLLILAAQEVLHFRLVPLLSKHEHQLVEVAAYLYSNVEIRRERHDNSKVVSILLKCISTRSHGYHLYLFYKIHIKCSLFYACLWVCPGGLNIVSSNKVGLLIRVACLLAIPTFVFQALSSQCRDLILLAPQ